jgi:hypothetical protein
MEKANVTVRLEKDKIALLDQWLPVRLGSRHSVRRASLFPGSSAARRVAQDRLLRYQRDAAGAAGYPDDMVVYGCPCR